MSTTIITTPASDDLAAIHDRMPLVLPRSAWDDWLDPSVGSAGATDLLRARPEVIRAREVSSLVSNVHNDSPALVEPVASRLGSPARTVDRRGQ